MNALILVVAILNALFAGGSCEIDTVTPYTGEGMVEWSAYPTGGLDYFATLSMVDTRTGASRFVETQGWRTFEGDMFFPFTLERGHVWKVSDVTCYVVKSGGTELTDPNGITWYIDTRYKSFIPILRR